MSSALKLNNVRDESPGCEQSPFACIVPDIFLDLKHCRQTARSSDCSGWQHHPVCARKYHFILPVRASPEAAAVHGNIPALVENWMQGSCKKPLRLPQYLADDAGNLGEPHPCSRRDPVGVAGIVLMPICSKGISWAGHCVCHG